MGGFGGADGLAAFLQREQTHALIDATHPFAARISQNAAQAAARVGVPLLRLIRPAWDERAGDRWIEVASMAQAARALGPLPRRVFLAIGRQEVSVFREAPQHDYLIRAIDGFEPGLARARVLCARGPFTREAEQALLVREGIEVLVSKNAGARATYAKIEAARALSLPVVMVARPPLCAVEETYSSDAVLAWLAAAHGAWLTRRGA
jgi:precorrin-6A/cobalt-precorrin-6A reductase